MQLENLFFLKYAFKICEKCSNDPKNQFSHQNIKKKYN